RLDQLCVDLDARIRHLVLARFQQAGTGVAYLSDLINGGRRFRRNHDPRLHDVHEPYAGLEMTCELNSLVETPSGSHAPIYWNQNSRVHDHTLVLINPGGDVPAPPGMRPLCSAPLRIAAEQERKPISERNRAAAVFQKVRGHQFDLQPLEPLVRRAPTVGYLHSAGTDFSDRTDSSLAPAARSYHRMLLSGAPRPRKAPCSRSNRASVARKPSRCPA